MELQHHSKEDICTESSYNFETDALTILDKIGWNCIVHVRLNLDRVMIRILDMKTWLHDRGPSGPGKHKQWHVNGYVRLYYQIASMAFLKCKNLKISQGLHPRTPALQNWHRCCTSALLATLVRYQGFQKPLGGGINRFGRQVFSHKNQKKWTIRAKKCQENPKS